jgi:hypothetical protein
VSEVGREAYKEAARVFADAEKALQNGNCNLAEELVSMAIAKAAGTIKGNQETQGTTSQKSFQANQTIEEMWAFSDRIAEAWNTNQCKTNIEAESVTPGVAAEDNSDIMRKLDESSSMAKPAQKSIEQQIVALFVKSKIQRTTGSDYENSTRSQVVETITDSNESEPEDVGNELDATADEPNEPIDEWEDDLELETDNEPEESTYFECDSHPEVCRCLALNGYSIQQVWEETDFNKVWAIIGSESMRNCLSE